MKGVVEGLWCEVLQVQERSLAGCQSQSTAGRGQAVAAVKLERSESCATTLSEHICAPLRQDAHSQAHYLLTLTQYLWITEEGNVNTQDTKLT